MGGPSLLRPRVVAGAVAAAIFAAIALASFVVTRDATAFEEAGRAVDPVALGLGDTIHALARDEPDVLRLDADGRTVARAALREAPTALVVVADANRAVAATTGTRRLWSLRATDLTDLRERTIDFEPDLVSPSPTGEIVAVGAIGEGVVTLVDPTTLEERARRTGLIGVHDLRFSPDGRRLYISTLDGARLLTLDAGNLSVLAETTLDAVGIDHMSRTPNGRTGLAVKPGSPVVTRLDLRADPRVDGTIELPTPPGRARLTEAGDAVWLASLSTDEAYRIDLEDGSVATVPLPGLMTTRAEEPFSPHALVATGTGLLRMGGDGRIIETAGRMPAFVSLMPVEGRAATLMMGEDGSLWREISTTPLSPSRLSTPPLFAITGVNDLAFCHG